MIAALAFTATAAWGQQQPSYVIADASSHVAARDRVQHAYGELPLLF